MPGSKVGEVARSPARCVEDNSGFKVMKNDVEAYRAGEKPIEDKQTNGFFTAVAEGWSRAGKLL